MATPIWDAPTCLWLINSKLGDRAKDAQDSVISVVERLKHASFHYQRARSITLDVFAPLGAKVGALAKIGLPHVGDGQGYLAEENIDRSANLIACVQALHAIPDTFAYAAFLCFKLHSHIPAHQDEGFVRVDRVICWLNEHPSGAGVALALRAMTGARSYKHIAGLSNHAKHRSIIRNSTSIDLRPGADFDVNLFFAGFTYRKKPYPREEALKLLQVEFDRMEPLVIECGCALNDFLASI